MVSASIISWHYPPLTTVILLRRDDWSYRRHRCSAHSFFPHIVFSFPPSPPSNLRRSLTTSLVFPQVYSSVFLPEWNWLKILTRGIQWSANKRLSLSREHFNYCQKGHVAFKNQLVKLQVFLFYVSKTRFLQVQECTW